jgi:hypothetical protein
MEEKTLSLFPDYEDLYSGIFEKSFINSCCNHMISLGYYSKIFKDRICIIDSAGESSCTRGTLVGWKFVDKIEEFISNNGYSWFGKRNDKNQEEISKEFAITVQFSNIISELLKKDNDE